MRLYSEDGVQQRRIIRARGLVTLCVDQSKGLRIVELGCGTLDISGPFAKEHSVIGIDCNTKALEKARERWPNASVEMALPDPIPCDILVLCEFLEHLPDPGALVKAWLPLAKQCVISHPLDGDLNGDLSGGEHQWSLNGADFRNWFALGGHSILNENVFRMGGYQIIMGREKRME